MTAMVAIHCDTELDDGSFCLGATSTNGPTTVAGLEVSALRRGWSRVGERHYCPTCTNRTVVCICGHHDGDHDPDDGCGACAMAMVGPCRTFRPK